MSINEIFFELIRVAIGTQDTLSRPPSKMEWAELYAMSKKQSLVGICFAGLQKLYNSVNQEPSTQNPQPNSTQNQEPRTKNLDEVQYLTWMGMAAKIQQRNEAVTKQCVELQDRLNADGMKCCILKGQGVASYYGSLATLRQSGDVDVWIPGDYIKIIEYLQKEGVAGKVTAIHAEAHFFEDPSTNSGEPTEVEVHSWPAMFRCPWYNARFKKFCKEHDGDWVDCNVVSTSSPTSFKMPSVEFNLVFLMVHMYQHLLREGIGLRQFWDYYFCLKSSSEEQRANAMCVIESLGMKNFMMGVMDIMNKFGIEESELLCPADPEIGVVLMEEIMKGGNFGHYDKRNAVAFDNKSNPMLRVIRSQVRNMRFLRLGFWEIVCSPVWRLWHWGWMKKNGYR